MSAALGTDEAADLIEDAIFVPGVKTQDKLYRVLTDLRVVLYRGCVSAPARPGDAGWQPAASRVEGIGPVRTQRLGVHLIAPIPELIDAECRIEVRPRSSALARHGVIIPTGTIDLGYRGELTAALYVAAPGGLAPDGIYALTQIVLSPGWRLIHCNISDDETARGHGGFGSTDGGAI